MKESTIKLLKNPMKCRICKKNMNLNKDHTVYFQYKTKTGEYRKARWCKKCDDDKPKLVEALFDRYQPGADCLPQPCTI